MSFSFIGIRQDTPEEPICSDFLLGKCKKGSTCRKHHWASPFHWQYLSGDNWRSFTEEDNEKIEKVYCDEKLDECTVADVKISFERHVLFTNTGRFLLLLFFYYFPSPRGQCLDTCHWRLHLHLHLHERNYGERLGGGRVAPSTEPFQSLEIGSIVSC